MLVLLAGGACSLHAADFYDYGLYFRSHESEGPDRTSLVLNEGRPFSMGEEFTIAFKLLVREREADFGPVLHLSTDRGEHVRFSYVSGENRHFPALVLNEEIVIIDMPIDRERWLDVAVRLRPSADSVELNYAGMTISAAMPLHTSRRVTALFGVMPAYSSDVAPVNLKDVVVMQGDDTVRYWRLYRHDDDICYDEIRHTEARAIHPRWLIDNHIGWYPVLHRTIPDRVDVAFDASRAEFYLVKDAEIEVLDENGVRLRTIPVRGGYRATRCQNHLLYDTLSRSLVSYFPEEGRISTFSFETGRWSGEKENPQEPHFYNHARAFDPSDSSYYFFGGYGFYQYRNELFRWKSGTDHIEQIEYEQPFFPRYSAAAAVVGDELYVFGGRGNKYGRQEIASSNYFGLHAINLRTLRSRSVWRRTEDPGVENVMASTMYFQPGDSSFYAVSMDEGGILWNLSMVDTLYREVSKPIGNEINYQDGDFSFYSSPAHGKMFLVLDKILSDRSHDVAIYSINLPLAGEADIRQTTDCPWWRSAWRWLCGLAAVVGIGVWFYRTVRVRKRRMQRDVHHPDRIIRTVDPAGNVADPISTREGETASVPVRERETASLPVRHYDSSRSAIRLLGNFRVFDRNGVEITSHFTPKLKNLLILLILHSERDQRGILALRATELLWPDKDGNSARNNRNVSLRKLRLLLEPVGDVEIISENNFLRIRLGGDLFCDYHEVVGCIRRFKQPDGESDPRLLDRIFELLLYGPLLPNTIAEWLDDFKDAYSSLSLDLLKGLLDQERRRDHQEMVLRIADIMFLHDPLSEEALAAKCTVLSAQGKNGLARNVYDRFCKEYRRSIGEEFGTPFTDL